MSCSSNIVELDQFRRVREALTVITRPVRREMQPPRVVDWYLPGMLGKAQVSTAFGDLPVEVLRRGDVVRTYSGATARIEAVDKIQLDQDFLRRAPGALPIRIPADLSP